MVKNFVIISRVRDEISRKREGLGDNYDRVAWYPCAKSARQDLAWNKAYNSGREFVLCAVLDDLDDDIPF